MNKLKKINLVVVKEYLLKHGEKVALGTCVFIALLLGMLALLRAFGAGRSDATGRPWAQELETLRKKIDNEIQQAQPEQLKPMQEAMLVRDRYIWGRFDLPHAPSPYLHISDKRGQDKRMNPSVLPIKHDKKDDKKYFQLDYIRACMLFYQNEQESRFELVQDGVPAVPMQPGASGTLPSLVKRAEPARMVAGYAIFPMKEQVEEFRKALRMASQKELAMSLEHKDLPRIIGFTLKRFEIGSNGKPINKEGEILIGWDKDGKFKISASVRRMLREAVYDDKGPIYLEGYTHAGLSMPMPRLGNAHYPRPDFEEIEIKKWYEDDDKRGGIAMPPPPPPNKVVGGGVVPGKGKKIPPMPMPEAGDPKPAGPEGKKKEITQKELKALNASLANRLFGKEKDVETYVNVYHALGHFPAREGAKGIGVIPPEGPRFFAPWKNWPVAAPKPADAAVADGGEANKVDPQGKPEQPVDLFPAWDKDALIRFIDPEVEPGSTYQYSIQIRMLSPNYKKFDLVAFEKIANAPELDPAIEVKTPQISIPREYHLYAVDQNILDDWAASKEDKKTIPAKDRDMTTFQIHQWVNKKDDLVNTTTHVIGDWAIAERVVVRRGDPIGIKTAVVVPVWKELRDAFEVPRLVDDPAPKDKKNITKLPGININLVETTVKSDGSEVSLAPPVLVDFLGGRRYKPSGVFEEETAVDALILTADGKLNVLNSRLDSDPLSADARDRQDRVTLSRRRAGAFPGGRGADPPRKVPGAN